MSENRLNQLETCECRHHLKEKLEKIREELAEKEKEIERLKANPKL